MSSWWEWGIDGMLYAADFAFGGPNGVSSWWEWGIDGMLYAADFAFGGPTGESLVAKGALTGMTKEVRKVTSKTATKELNKKEGIHQRYR